MSPDGGEKGNTGGGMVKERLGGVGGAKVEVGREGSERGEVVGGSHGRLVGIGGGSRRSSSHGGSEVEMLHSFTARCNKNLT